jgi:hypothetical protein
MKTFLLLSAVLIGLSLTGTGYFSLLQNGEIKSDSGIINHKQDGIVDEWPVDKFSADKESGIQYALDNDAENIYMALIITSQPEQMKLMSMGMRMFIDMKAKHKENRGVEFPIKKETGSMPMPQPGGQGNDQGQQPDPKRIRMLLGRNLIALKLFGFTDGEPTEQELDIDGSARIAYYWDSLDVMQVEYLIPLKMLEPDITSLNQKLISIGWIINGLEISGATSSSGNPGSVRTGMVAVPAGPGGISRGSIPTTVPGNNRPGSGKFTQADMDKMMKEQEIWTKYTFTIPVK